MKNNDDSKQALLDRLAHLTPEKRQLLLKKLNLRAPKLQKEPASREPFSNSLPYCYISQAPGDVSSLSRENIDLPPLEHNQVQIEAKAVSLNFRDLMIALNLYPKSLGIPTCMGSDYAGIVLKCGKDVTEFKPGDEVIALYPGDSNPDNHFRSHVNTYVYQTVRKPKHLSFTQAATIPTAFLTAYFGLAHLGRLQQDEKILIHSATGGVGLAAIQVAKHFGAKIFATAGNEEKRAFLKTLGIDQPMDSRSLDFAKSVMEQTEHEGVDLILNTLTGDAIDEGLKSLSRFGRFIQIEKSEIYNNRQLDLGLFKNGQAFSFLDLTLFHMNKKAQNLLKELIEFFEKGIFHPLKSNEFPIAKLDQALRYMSQSKHMGKIVVNYEL